MKPVEKPSTLPTRLDALAALGLAVLSLILYIRTLLPSLIPNDGAEFQTLAYTLGHAHTTGYEVYTLLAKAFTTLVPVRDIAYRVNLLSAVCAAATVALVYLIGRLLSGSRWAGLLAALTLAVSATFWSQAIIAEVYTMGSLFTAAILLVVLYWYETGRARFLFAAGLLGGLSVGVHGTVLLLAPAILVLLILKIKDLRQWWKAALLGPLAGLLLMFGIFAIVDAVQTRASVVQSTYIPSISRWDLQPEDMDTLGERFAFLVFARQWRSAMFVDPDHVIPENLTKFDQFYQQDFAWPVRFLTLVGLAALFFSQDRRRWRLGLFFIAAILVHWYYTFNYRIGDIYVFFISLYVYYCALTAEGLGVLLRWLGRLPGLAPRIAQPALAAALLVLALAPVYSHRVDALTEGELRFEFMGLPSNQELKDWHTIISYNAEALPQDAIVLMDWYNLYGYFYAAHVEQGRTDLSFLEAYPYSNKEGMADTLFVYIKDHLKQGCQVYTLQEIGELQRGGLVYHSRPVGFSTMYQVEMP